MQVAVVVTHQGWGEGTEVWGVYADMAAAVAAVKAEGMYAYSERGVTKLRGHGRNGGPFGTIEMFEVKS